ncbi:MAG: enoyl-CoA hydratase-related protein, partial [Mycobacteriaceae bacterium]
MSVLVRQEGETAWITLARPERRNALAEDMLQALLDALEQVRSTKATGIVLAAQGPVFCSGHDFADVHGRDLASSRDLLRLCTSVMRALQTGPQVVIARVHGLATAAGCQLV